MLKYSSATKREETPHATNSTQINNLTGIETITAGVRRRAESIVKDKSIDGQTRAVIRYGLEVNDPWLPELVRRVDAGESITDAIAVLAESSAS